VVLGADTADMEDTEGAGVEAATVAAAGVEADLTAEEIGL